MSLDFFRIRVKESRKKDGPIEVYPEFVVGRSKDLMVQGKAFYAIYDERKGYWSRDEYDVAILVDAAIREKVEELEAAGTPCTPRYLSDYDSGRWDKFQKFVKNVSDNSHPLDVKITFANTEIKRSDYVSRRLPYNMAPGSIEAYDTLMSRLYAPEERAKFEWAIGAVISGDAKKIQKFLVFYGKGGTGKSTVMEIITKLFGGKVKDGGYVEMFDAQSLVGSNSQFSMEPFKNNPLVAIQHDGDLSFIQDNTKLNSIVSHEDMRINEKYKATYDSKINAFLFMGTNKPVQITDAKSGLIRRLIDVNPTNDTFEPDDYHTLFAQIDFELGAIAHHCLQVYKKMGRNAYNGYEPRSMMLQTDVFFNFVQDHFDIFKEQDGTTLAQAWSLYTAYCDDAKLKYTTQRHKFRESLKDYFVEFHERTTFQGAVSRSVYLGFKTQQYKTPIVEDEKTEAVAHKLILEETTSLLDEMYAGLPAQYPGRKGGPKLYWDDSERLINGEMRRPKPSEIASTVLGDLDTRRIHFLKVPENHIVIDFDLKGDDGKKSLEANLKAAAEFPATYAELSKSGSGVHLHYIYDGDVTDLANVYSEDIEIKVYTGNASLRRKLSYCNNTAVATISSGLPFKEKTMLPGNTLQNEKGLRTLVMGNLRKQYHPGTKPSIDFIEHLLNQAYEQGTVYDLTDLRPRVMAFANNSTNQAVACLKAVQRMRFKSELTAEEAGVPQPVSKDDRIVFFDCEVYPNLFVICWRFMDADPSTMAVMINPTPAQVEQLFQFKLVGFNNRFYDNHILWGAFLGYNNQQLFELSQRIIVEKDQNARFGEAYNLSYADVWDFAVNKQGLKKWEIQLGIPHMEMSIPWDKPVPKELWDDVVKYCSNDVNALEAVFKACKADFMAREILSGMSGLPVNSPTRQHAVKIIFGNDRVPQGKFVYTDLSQEFPGYSFDPYAPEGQKSTYRGEFVGEGGYVYAEPGIYENVALLDVASMHPTSIINLNLFGPYTENFVRLVEARLAIKHGEYAKASEMLGVEVNEENAKALSNALKLVINSVYGYTSAKFDNPFRDKRNVDNIVAKRGALFMIDLKHALQEQGYTVAHIKTDSVKIPEADQEVIEFVYEFGAKYGYTFEHETTYAKFCLVNDAVYIAKETEKDAPGAYEERWDVVDESTDGATRKVAGNGNDMGLSHGWTATGAQFQHPYVYKTLFTGEGLDFKDLCETKQVREGAIYLGEEGEDDIEKMHHVGSTGLFVPVRKEAGGKKLWRVKDGRKYAVTGTKDYYWVEAETILALKGDAVERMVFENLEDAVAGTGSLADIVDVGYFEQLALEAAETIEKFGDFKEFVA